MGLFRILLIIVLLFYAFSLIVKTIFNRKIKRLNREMEHFEKSEAKDENGVQKNPRVNPDIGEYTDFEEIE